MASIMDMVHPQQPQSSPPDTESQASPFSCNICQKTYTRVDHLARHVRSHTQEKPFSCPICGKSFARADLLKRHSANHEDSPDGRKRRRLNQPQSRVAQACVACASSKLRCSGDDPCKRCEQKNLDCRYNKPRTSVITDDTRSPDGIETGSSVHDDWQAQPLSTHNVVVGNEYHHHQQSASPGLRRTSIDDHKASRIQLGQPVQLPTPSSSGQPMDIGPFQEPLYEAGPNTEPYESPFADFLKDVMMQDPISSETLQTNMAIPNKFPNFDLLNIAGDQNIYYFHDPFNSYIPTVLQDPPIHQLKNETQATTQSTSGHVTPSAQAGIKLGAQAFKESIWLYAPSQANHVGADKNNMFLPLENLVTKTRYRGPPPCDGLEHSVRDRILATVLAESSTSVVPDVLSSFPSPEMMTNLIHQFLVRHEQRDDAWIHLATFNPNIQYPEFLMSVIAAGGSISDLPQIRNLGFAFQESARRSVTEQIERDNRTIRYLRPLQTYALQLHVGLWSGDRRRMELSESHALLITTMIRRGGFLRQSSNKSDVPDINDSAEIIESKWKQWVEKESFKRLVFHLFMKDTQTSISLIMPPSISPSEMLVELPAAADLWRARSSEEWKSLYLSKYSGPRGSIPTLRAATDNFSIVSNYLDIIDIPLTNLLILCSLWSLSWQYRELIRLNVSNPGGNSSTITKSLYQEIVHTLQRFKLYSSDWMSGSQPLAMILHERVLLNLHASLEDVQLFAGKAGEEEARRIIPVLAHWAQGREARIAVCHAGQIFRAAKEHTKQTLVEFSAVSLYHASLVFWAYSIMSTCQNASANPHSSPREGQQFVFIDGNDDVAVQRFIELGKGYPALNAGLTLKEKRVVPVNDARAVMSAVIDVFKRNNGGGTDEEMSPLVLNLSKLMRSLGNAAKSIKMGQQQSHSHSQGHSQSQAPCR